MKAGDQVSWKWGDGTAKGTVKEVHTKSTEISSNGSTIKRNGTEDNPALVIEDESGSKVLKLTSEVNN